MNDNICFNLVDNAKTEKLPDGDAALAWKNLLTRYEPKQFGSLLILKNEFFSKTLENCAQSPDLLYLELEQIRPKK